MSQGILAFSYHGMYFNITSIEDLEVEFSKTFGHYYSGSIVIPETVDYGGQTFTVTSIAFGSFVDCSHLTSVFIPKTVIREGGQLFNSCYSLKSITVDKDNPSFKDIDGVMFTKDENTLLYYPGGKTETEYSTPSGTRNIGGGSSSYSMKCVFYANNYIKEIFFNEGVETFSGASVDVCKNLTTIHIPSTVVNIKYNAFDRLNALKDIYIYTSIPPSIESGAFSNDIYLGVTLHVPQGSINKYQSKSNWKNFFNIEEFDATDIKSIIKNNKKADLKVNFVNGTLNIQGVQGNHVKIYSIDGKLLDVVGTQNGCCSFIPSYHNTTIIIKDKVTSTKLLL